jgi:hypothetical protein
MLDQADDLAGITLDLWQTRLHIRKVVCGNEIDRRVLGYEWTSETAEYDDVTTAWEWVADEDLLGQAILPTAVAAYEDYWHALDRWLERNR